MPWPFVSRAYADELARERDWWRTVALNSHPTLRPPVDPVAPTRVVTAEPSWDDVGTAVMWRAGTNTALREHLAQFATEERAKGRPAAEVLRRVQVWDYQPGSLPADRVADQEHVHARVAQMLDEDV